MEYAPPDRPAAGGTAPKLAAICAGIYAFLLTVILAKVTCGG